MAQLIAQATNPIKPAPTPRIRAEFRITIIGISEITGHVSRARKGTTMDTSMDTTMAFWFVPDVSPGPDVYPGPTISRTAIVYSSPNGSNQKYKKPRSGFGAEWTWRFELGFDVRRAATPCSFGGN